MLKITTNYHFLAFYLLITRPNRFYPPHDSCRSSGAILQVKYIFCISNDLLSPEKIEIPSTDKKISSVQIVLALRRYLFFTFPTTSFQCSSRSPNNSVYSKLRKSVFSICKVILNAISPEVTSSFFDSLFAFNSDSFIFASRICDLFAFE
jgi:hypothetical protein